MLTEVKKADKPGELATYQFKEIIDVSIDLLPYSFLHLHSIPYHTVNQWNSAFNISNVL